MHHVRTHPTYTRERMAELRAAGPVESEQMRTATWRRGEMPATDEYIDWFGVVAAMFGGMALFLYGMHLLESSLKSIAGDRLRY